ncbi:DNA (cytosine-5-)-methyltransferase [[Clostridium] symbiosum]|uniref:DNA (cytosine-5-)-methyltransferase n=1 Tax=Clostridium symbiosum TaxID=1512 RepID=UPI001AA155A3|nr:DNA (cytosine-5-)-methyltransferase [[Clostridium] symbiosum]MBO1695221.1 DNA (cytosine-5-)-methyltransferase [[Clostridium] symbiosum]
MDYKLVNFCEFDKYAVRSYCAIHGVDESLNLGDITKVDEKKLPYFNFICGGSPCQDFSLSGKLAGSVWRCRDCCHEINPLQVHWSKREFCEKCGSKNLDKTRSSLLVEWLRIIREVRPVFGIYENVKNIVQARFLHSTFRLFEQELQEYGYNTYWRVLNAKNYGIPQNRERLYLVMVKKEYDNGKFVFPEPVIDGKRLMDLLEKKVDEKYYLSDDKVKNLITDVEKRKALLYMPGEEELKQWENKLHKVGQVGGCGKEPQTERVYSAIGQSPTLTASGGSRNKIAVVGKVGNSQQDVVLSGTGVANTQLASHDQTKILEVGAIRGRYNEKGNVEQRLELGNELENCYAITSVQKDNILLVRQDTLKGYEECIKNGVANLSYPNTKGKRGRVQGNGVICPTITSQGNSLCCLESLLRIRRLTPLECFRLMGFDDEDYQAVKDVGISNSQAYKQAGNSIVVNVLERIYEELYKAMPYLFEDLKVGSFFTGIGAFEKALERFYRNHQS